MKYLVSIAIVVRLVIGTPVQSAEISQLTVVKDQGRFTTEAIFIVAAPRDAIVRTLTDFNRLSELNPAIVSSRAVRLSSEITRVSTEVRDCVSFLCRTVSLVEDVIVDGLGNVESQVVAELSDFSGGNTVWRFEAIGSQTRIHFRSQIDPKFWIPPVLGSRVFRRALERQIIVAANNIEALSSAQ